jgi:hypothetical protein
MILLCLYPFVDRDVENAQEAVREELDADVAAFDAVTAEEGGGDGDSRRT